MPRPKRKSSAAKADASPSSSVVEKKPKIVEEKKEEVSVSSSDGGDAVAVVVEASDKVMDRVSPAKRSGQKPEKPKKEEEEEGEEVESRFVGDPVPEDEARLRWPYRYLRKNKAGKSESLETSKGLEPQKEYMQARRHFSEALVDGNIKFKLGDDGYVQADEGQDNYICKIVEMFEGVDRALYFTAQWFYRAKDTIIQACSDLIDEKRVFFSEIKDDNPLDCLLEKLKIVRVPLDLGIADKHALLGDGDYYYDMSYLVPYSTYQNLPPVTENDGDGNESDSTISSESDVNGAVNEVSQPQDGKKSVMRMLDLYSGCGGMSTGLCLGANMADVNLVTRWAVDLNKYACESLKLNHPETEVRNVSAEDFLMLLREWEKLCQSFSLIGGGDTQPIVNPPTVEEDEDEDEEEADDDTNGLDEEIFEVEEVLAICYGDPKEIKKPGLYLKIRWKGYGPEEDTWEPIEGLSDCHDKIKEFVVNGFNAKILPLPGQVDVICGGPPCQGISGFNRFRNKDNPLEDEKNQQLVVYMNIVEYLKPRFALMENVVDIVKFAKGFLGRYALGRLVSMNYQARVGLMVAGSYGLPQFRRRMFMWGARPSEKLPQYPLPTHKVVTRGVSPLEFESNTVVHEDPKVELEKELFLGDAISDLPSVANDETRDEMPYGEMPKTEFQRFIRLRKDEMPGFSNLGQDSSDHLLYDHRPLKLNDDDHERVCQVPKSKGANFRDLKGVRVKDNNQVEWDPDVERVYLTSGKPLVPDYAMTFVNGKSTKPFGRMWWDETVPTVVTRAEPHNQAILHPLQDRVLTVRENARLQGFPDYYKLLGPIKERYIQVGNAVAVPVGRALGYSLAMSCKGIGGTEPTFALPSKFPNVQPVASPSIDEQNQ